MKTRANILELANAKLTTYLTEKNMRRTPERYEVLRMVIQTKGPFTIDELTELMDEKAEFRVSRTTLFNVLDVLMDAQLVVKHAFTRAVRYECILIPHPLINIRCLHCGKFEKVEIPQLEETLREVKSRKLSISQQIVYLSGICRKCEAKERNENKKNKKKTKHNNNE